jgi:hypothetical protein
MVAHSVRLGVSTETHSLRQQTENLSHTAFIRIEKLENSEKSLPSENEFITIT